MKFGEMNIARLMWDAVIVRYRIKIDIAIRNAQLFLHIPLQKSSVSNDIWGFIDGQSARNN